MSCPLPEVMFPLIVKCVVELQPWALALILQVEAKDLEKQISLNSLFNVIVPFSYACRVCLFVLI